jgi:hypothetical protein
MAELLVLTTQRMNRSMFPGDVVTVQPDGWAWGKAERGPEADPMFCVITVPGVPPSAFTEFLQSVNANGAQVLFRRVHLNLAALGESPTLEQVMAARMEKTLTPLLS